MELVVAVDPDSTGVQLLGNPGGLGDILGEHSGSQTVLGVIGLGDDVFLILELDENDDWAEDLLLNDLHAWLDVGEDGWLDEVTLITVPVTTHLTGGTLGLTLLDVAHDSVVLNLRDLGTLEGLSSEWVSHLVLGRLGEELLPELFVDGLLDEDPGTGTATLPVIQEDTEASPLDGLVNVSIGEDDVGGFTTELESDVFEVGGGSGLHDHSADSGGTSESNLADLHVGRDSGADG